MKDRDVYFWECCEEHEMREHAEHLLKQLQRGSGDVGILKPALANVDERIRFMAAWIVSELGVEAQQLHGEILMLLTDSNVNIRRCAANTIVSFEASSLSAIPVDRLLLLLADNDSVIRGIAFRILLSVDDSYFDRILDTIVKTTGIAHSELAYVVLNSARHEDHQILVLSLAINVRNALDNRSRIAFAFKHPNPEIRHLAVRVADKCDFSHVVPLLSQAIVESDTLVLGECLNAVSSIFATRRHERLESLYRFAESESEFVSLSAIMAIDALPSYEFADIERLLLNTVSVTEEKEWYLTQILERCSLQLAVEVPDSFAGSLLAFSQREAVGDELRLAATELRENIIKFAK